jgi:Viral BACON domain/Putative binding domain, N-terminal
MGNSLQRYCVLLLLAAGIIGAACNKSSPVAPTPPPCAYTLSPSSLSIGGAGGDSVVTVTAAASCAWTATSDRAWMSIASGASGTGSGTVHVTVSANPNTAERAGTLTVGTQSVPVVQAAAAPCTIQISPASASVGKDSANGSFAVMAADRCSWTASSHASWFTITAGSVGAGNGTVAYAIERNRELSNRTGTITVGDQIFTVTQQADTGPAPVCDYSVTPVEFTPCMSAPVLTATVTTQAGCSWTVEPDASWITVTNGGDRTGPGVISFKPSDNWAAPRHGVIKVRWPTITAGQNLQIQQAGCLYAVSTPTVSIPAAGGAGRFDVLQQSEPYTCGGPTQNACMWSAQSDSPWITVTTSMPQFGDNPVSFSVAPNDGTVERTGRISVRDQVVLVTQAAR